MSDNFSGTTVKSIIKPLRPKGEGWTELEMNQKYSMGYPSRAYINNGLTVISAVEVVADEDKGFEYHISITKQSLEGVSRCDSKEAKWVLKKFGLDGWEEDNHVPYGKARHFWRPVAENLVGLECKCKKEEPAIVEDKGDFVWRPDSQSQ